VTAAELRRYNDFFGEQFKCCEVLRVPRKGQQGHSRRQVRRFETHAQVPFFIMYSACRWEV
jgi:hypothetical protein